MLLYANGFDLTTTPADRFSTINGTVNIGAFGRNGGQGMSIGGDDSHFARINLGGSFPTLIVGFAFTPQSIPATRYVCHFLDNGTVQGSITIQNDGTVHLTSASGSFTLSIGVYAYLEFKFTCHNSAGAWVVRVNGVEVLNETGLDTQSSGNAFCTQFALGGVGGGTAPVTRYYDDLVIMDLTDGTATQGAPLNDFLGDVKVEALLPSGAGDSTDAVPSAGANYQCVDEANRNDDTDFVSSATPGDKDLYALPDLSSSIGTIHAVVVTMRARKDDAGTRTIKAKVKHGGVEGSGADRGLSTTYAYTQDVFGANPSTGSPWTVAEVNAMQAGFEVVA